MKYCILIMLAVLAPRRVTIPFSYDKTLVEISTLTVKKEPYGIVKLKKIGSKIKIKYFAFKSNNGTAGQRYAAWAKNRNIVAYSSGTYMDHCNARIASPVGLCIDQGITVNANLSKDGLDGLVIVRATGSMVATNLKDGDLSVAYPGGKTSKLNIRDVAYDMEEFKNWAKDNEATVFQTHLFVYKNQFLVNANSKPTLAQRRFLAMGTLANGDVVYYIINLSTPATLLAGAQKAFNYLQEIESVKEVGFLLNLDTGCQDIFKLFDPMGQEFVDRAFQGDHRIELSNASNVLAFYYE